MTFTQSPAISDNDDMRSILVKSRSETHSAQFGADNTRSKSLFWNILPVSLYFEIVSGAKRIYDVAKYNESNILATFDQKKFCTLEGSSGPRGYPASSN
jgi:hypothetical protein